MTVKETGEEQPLPIGAEPCGEGALPLGGTLVPQHHLPGALTFTRLSRASHSALPASVCWRLLSLESHRATSPGFILPASISPFLVSWHQLSPTPRAGAPGNLCLGITSCSSRRELSSCCHSLSPCGHKATQEPCPGLLHPTVTLDEAHTNSLGWESCAYSLHPGMSAGTERADTPHLPFQPSPDWENWAAAAELCCFLLLKCFPSRNLPRFPSPKT